MIKKIFYSALLFLFSLQVAYCVTYFFQGTNPGPEDFNTLSNWNSIPTGGGTTPSSFSSSSDIWDLNGFNANLSANLTLAGDLKNSGVAAYIDVQGKNLTLQGIVAGANLSITDGFPLPSPAVVEYSSSVATIKDIIAGTYSNLTISGANTFIAGGDIAVTNTLNTSGSSAIDINMNAHNLIDSGSFSIGSLGTGLFTITTQSDSTAPIPSYNWPNGVSLVFNGTGTVQYIPEGSYDDLQLSGNGEIKEVQAGDTVLVRSNFVNSAHLVMQADATGYGQFKTLVAMDNGSGTGTVRKQYYFDASIPRYYHMGLPLIGADLQDLNDGQTMTFANDNTGSVWRWDVTTNVSDPKWVAPSQTGNTATEGYTVFVGATPHANYITNTSQAVEVEGSDMHYQNQSVLLTYNVGGASSTFVDAINNGWNFVANPFLGNYDFEKHDTISSTIGTIAAYYYVFNGTNYSFYQKGGLSNGTGGSASNGPSASQYIAPGQGVWFRTRNTWNGFTTFEAANVDMTGASQMFKTTLAPDIIKLNVAEVGGAYSDQVIIRLDANATDAEDFSLDVPKKSNPGNVPNTFIQLGNGTYALCAAHPSRKSFPLHFRDIDHGQQMEYSIWENSLASYGKVFIEDKKNNSFSEITHANYTFTNDTAFGEDRFVIHFESGVGLPEGMIPEAASYDAFYSNGSINFTFQEENFKPTSGALYTLQGKLISKFEVNDAKTTVNIPNVPTGIYLISLENDTAGARKLYIQK